MIRLSLLSKIIGEIPTRVANIQGSKIGGVGVPWSFLVFFAITILILYPTLTPGYVLTGDMVFPPYSSFMDLFFGSQEFLPTYISGHLPLYSIIFVTSLIMPMWVVQKILIIAIFMASSYGSQILAGKAGSNGIASVYAGLIYAFNPFVQVRLLEGHWKFLLGYALFPLALLSFWSLLRERNKRSLVIAIIMSMLISSTSIHVLALLALAYFVITIWYIFNSPKATAASIIAWTSVMAGTLILLNAYWWVPYGLAQTTIMDQFTNLDLELFSSSRPRINTIVDTVGMYGYWDEGRYFLTRDAINYWPLLTIIFVSLSLFGVMSSWSNISTRPLTWSLTLLFLIGLLMAPGVNGLVPSAIEFIYEHVAAFRGFREPQKFTMLIVIWLSIMGSFGLTELKQLLTPPIYNALAFLVCSMVLLYSFTMFNGFSHQLVSTHYPTEWENASEIIRQDPSQSNLLVLPWQNYLDLSWNGSRVQNPSWAFFPGRVISAHNQFDDPTQRYISALLAHGDEIDNFGDMVMPLGIEYVLLLKEANYNKYDFLYQNADLNVILDNQKLTLFKNANNTPLVWGSDTIRIAEDFKDFLESNRSQEINRHIWIEEGTDIEQKYQTRQSQHTCDNLETQLLYKPLSLSIKIPPRIDCEYLILSLSSPYWTYLNDEGITHITGSKVFRYNGTDSHIEFVRFNHQLLGYVMTFLGLIGLSAFTLVKSSKEPAVYNTQRHLNDGNETQ